MQFFADDDMQYRTWGVCNVIMIENIHVIALIIGRNT